MAVTLSNNEGSDQDSDSDQECKFMAFTTIAVTDETVDVKVESPFDEELFENDDLPEAYNKFCKIVAKDAITIDLSLKKIDSLELGKKTLLIKLFDTNEFLNAVKIENISLVEKVKELEIDLCVTREHLGMPSSSKLDEMLGTQKSSFYKTS